MNFNRVRQVQEHINTLEAVILFLLLVVVTPTYIVKLRKNILMEATNQIRGYSHHILVILVLIIFFILGYSLIMQSSYVPRETFQSYSEAVLALLNFLSSTWLYLT